MKDWHRWLIGILIGMVTTAIGALISFAVMWGTIRSDVDNVMKQVDDTKATVNKIYDILIE